jgi:hypothetical protein
MKCRYIVIAATVIAVFLYLPLYRQFFALGAVYLLRPSLLHGARHLGDHTLLMLLHAAATLVLNVLLLLPVAIVLGVVFRRGCLVLAAAVALWLLAPDILSVPKVWEGVADHGTYIAILAMGVASVFTALLGSTYLASRMTSNLRWSGHAA